MSFLFLTAARRRTPPHAPDLCFSAAGRAPGQCGPACHAPQKLAEFRPKDVSNVRRDTGNGFCVRAEVSGRVLFSFGTWEETTFKIV